MSFASLKQIDAGVLNVGYVEVGPTAGPAVILLHGWPYDIHSFVDVAWLASAGYRVIVPYGRRGMPDVYLILWEDSACPNQIDRDRPVCLYRR